MNATDPKASSFPRADSPARPFSGTRNVRSAIPLLCALGGYWLLLIHQLGAQWSIYSQYNYGWSVPFLCGYLIWLRIRDNQPSGTQKDSAVVSQAGPSKAFYILLGSCLVLYGFTRFVHEANPVWRVSSWLLALEVIGLTLLLAPLLSHFRVPGFGGRISAGSLSFPLCFFLVAVPWLYPVEAALVEWLTKANVAATVELLGWLGIPGVQHGNVIEISAGAVGVDEACSGIRSFQATLMISLFLGELFRLTARRRLLLVISGFALAFSFNVIRTLLLTRIACAKGVGAIASWHDPAGVTILIACFASLWLLALWLKRPRPLPPVVEGRAGGNPPVSSSILARVACGLVAWFVLVECGTELWYRSHETTARSATVWSVPHPAKDASYSSAEISAETRALFKYDSGVEFKWQDSNGAQWQLFYFRWLPARSLDRRVFVQRAKMHGPATCLPKIGITMKEDLGPTKITIGDFNLPVQQYAFDSSGKPLYVFFGIYEDQSGSEVLANRRIGTANRIGAALAGSRNYGQRFLELAVHGYNDGETARAALSRELQKLITISPSNS